MLAARSIVARAVVGQIAKRAVPKIAAQAFVANFSSGLSKKRKQPEEEPTLAELLSKEHRYELDQREVDTEYEDVKKLVSENFKINEEDGGSEVVLTRQVGDEKITITFDVQDVEEAEFDDEQVEGEDFDEEDMTADAGVNIRIQIEKAGRERSLIVHAVASDSIVVSRVGFLPTGVKDDSEEAARLYSGPDFTEVDERVYDAFLKHLESAYQIDNDLAFFIFAHTREKEQAEYVRWLEHFQSYLSK